MLVMSIGSGSVVAGVTVVVPVQSYSKSHMVKVSTHNYMCTESTISSLVPSRKNRRKNLSGNIVHYSWYWHVTPQNVTRVLIGVIEAT